MKQKHFVRPQQPRGESQGRAYDKDGHLKDRHREGLVPRIALKGVYMFSRQDLGCRTLLVAFLLVAMALPGKHFGLRLRHESVANEAFRAGALSGSTVDMDLKKLVAKKHLSGYGEVLSLLNLRIAHINANALPMETKAPRPSAISGWV